MWRSIKSGSKVAYNVLCLATVLAIVVAPSFFGVARVAFTVVGTEGWLRFFGQISLGDEWICRSG